MIDGLPIYVSIVFVLTTITTLAFLFSAVRSTRREKLPQKLIMFFMPLWLMLSGFLALAGFYLQFDAFPPRVFLFGAFPALFVSVLCVVVSRPEFVDRISLRTLTLLHVVRVPVELVLLWLYQADQVPRQMTFEGLNFDILSGITAPLVYWLAFRGGRADRPLLLIWNLAALALLVNVVTIAVLSFKSPSQQIAFDQPNVGVAYFPFIWLPAVVVPVVFFAHIAALVKMIRERRLDG